MAARDELRKLINENRYVSKVMDDLEEILRGAVRKKTVHDGIKDFYVPEQKAEKYDGLLIRLGLVYPYGLGVHSIGYLLRKRGIDLGRRFLEESRRTSSSFRQ